MGAPRETEVKLRVRDVAAAREAVRAIGARLARPRHFEDNVLFDDAGGSLRASGTVLRLRRTRHGAVLTFKGPREIEGGVKSREERETTVGDAHELQAVLHGLGYRPQFRYQKHRETWTHRGQEIEVDETPIGAFLEIEGDREGIEAVAAQLGYTAQDYVSDSYVGLFFAQGGEGDMVFDSACPAPTSAWAAAPRGSSRRSRDARAATRGSRMRSAGRAARPSAAAAIGPQSTQRPASQSRLAPAIQTRSRQGPSR